MNGFGAVQPRRAWRFALPVATTAWVGLLVTMYYTIDNATELSLILLTPLFPLGMGGSLMGLIGLGINWAIWFVIFSVIRASFRGSRRYWQPKS